MVDILNDFINILITYWKPIVGLLFTIAGFIIAVIKKKPITDILTDIYYYAILGVNYAESLGSSGDKLTGEQKLNAAIYYVNQELKKKYPTLNTDKYLKLVTKIIEDLLTTPHKKGV